MQDVDTALNVFIIGSGGREHALLKSCLSSPRRGEIYALPGNAGMAQEATCLDISVENIEAIVAAAQSHAIDLVIVGPEVPLCLGLADALEQAGIACYGPKAQGAAFEASKALTNSFLAKYDIPTSTSATFTDLPEALAYLHQQALPIVIKADGLAAGKGVIITDSLSEAEEALTGMLSGEWFGQSGKTVVIEECMTGPEASIMLMVSGEKYLQLPFSQDHKRIGEGDTGLNTGGMGAYAPAQVVDSAIDTLLQESIIEPTLAGFTAEGIDYRGTLYIGVMLTPQGPKVLEFNVRFGDPETQVLLPLLESDALSLMWDCAQKQLQPEKVQFKDQAAMVVVMAAGGYPGDYKKGEVISFPPEVAPNTAIIHAGTKNDEAGNIITNGGRVLGITALADNLEEAAQAAYQLCQKVNFADAYYRKDIAHQELGK